MKRGLVVLYISMFIVMTGYGLTLTVLPFYIERMALGAGASSEKVSVHVGTLTGVFALMQFFFAPLWGTLSDKVGRRRIFLVGLGGNSIFNALFGLGSGLSTFYITRILGGIFSAAILPTANAYVADVTSESDRGKNMARLNAAIALGVVAGPALGAWLIRRNWHPAFGSRHFFVDSFSTPFFVAALLGMVALVTSAYMLPEPSRAGRLPELDFGDRMETAWMWSPEMKSLLKARSFWRLLLLSFLSWFSLALFEGTFALHAQQVMKFGPSQLGMVFMVCGLVMAVGQAAIVGRFIDHKRETPLIAIGLGLMGTSLPLLMLTEVMAFILICVALLAFGVALLIPTLSTLVSRQSQTQPGTALGLQTAVNSLGQFAGPVIGGFLFAWSIHLPYLATAALLLATAIFLCVKMLSQRRRKDA